MVSGRSVRLRFALLHLGCAARRSLLCRHLCSRTQQHSWLISAFVLAILEVVPATRTDLWTALRRSSLDGLGLQGMHIFTYAFLFFLGCKASFHRWLERLNTHLVVRWFRFSVALALCLLAIALVLTFNGSMSSELGKLSFLGTFLIPFIGWGMIAYLLLWFQRNENQYIMNLQMAFAQIAPFPLYGPTRGSDWPPRI